PVSPEGWRNYLINRAEELEREARLAEAHATPFEMVLAKVKGNTSMIVLKVWCEGKTDIPVLREFLQKNGVTGVVFDSVGGWGNFDAKEPERLRDGCRQVFVVMDGDNGRHLRKKNKPLTDLAKRVQKRLEPLGIPLRVLEMYGIENYFSQKACEEVLGRD